MYVNRMTASLCVLMCALVGLFGATSAEAKSERTTRVVKLEKQIHLLQKKVHESRSTIRFFTNPSRRWMLHNRYSHLPCWKVPLKGPERLCALARGAVRASSKQIAVAQAGINRLESNIWNLKAPWCKATEGNRQLGCRLAFSYWPSAYEWHALDALWHDESKWDEHADNPTSSACGIPQAMNDCAFGYDPEDQIRWGIKYILHRPGYGRPSNARAMFLSRHPHWY